jgi:hypothetical protein
LRWLLHDIHSVKEEKVLSRPFGIPVGAYRDTSPYTKSVYNIINLIITP